MGMVNRDAIARAVAEKTGRGTQAEVREMVDATLAAIRERAEAGDTIRFNGFGTFQVKARPARMGRNPATGAAIEIPESRKLVFKASKVA